MTLGITFNYQREEFSLDVALTLPNEGVTAIFGPSGSGKTTLLRVIAGLENIDGASIRFNDQTWQDHSRFVPVHERNIGFVFQEASLFPHLNVQENLEYGFNRQSPGKRQVSIEEAAHMLEIENLLHRKPDALSGGEQQRVAIARTLSASPGLLLMDEPLSSLDHKLKQTILPFLENIYKELAIPVIYVSHATDEVARLADQLVILKKGEVLGNGPIQEMLTRLDLPLSHRSDAESLVNATVSSKDEAHALTHLNSSGHTFIVTGTDLEIGDTVRLRIAAHDVSLTLDHQSGTSIQNIFPVTVTEIQDENPSQVLVKLALDTSPILARITRKAVQELDIAPGKNLFAQIKSVAVLS